MPLIWNDVYKVGYHTIDVQHIGQMDKKLGVFLQKKGA